MWSIDLKVRTASTKLVLSGALDELARLRREPLTPMELDAARRGALGLIGLRIDGHAKGLEAYALLWHYGLPRNYWQGARERLANVTPERIQMIANKYLAPERLQIVIAGDVSPIAKDMEAYGKVVIYDTEGQRRPNARNRAHRRLWR